MDDDYDGDDERMIKRITTLVNVIYLIGLMNIKKMVLMILNTQIINNWYSFHLVLEIIAYRMITTKFNGIYYLYVKKYL